MIGRTGGIHPVRRQVGPTLRARHAPGTLAAVFCGTELSLLAMVALSAHAYGLGLFSAITVAILAGIHFTARTVTPLIYRVAELAAVLAAAATVYAAGNWIYHSSQMCAYSFATLPEMVANLIMASLALLGLIVLIVDRVRVAAQATSHALRTPGATTPETRVEIGSGIGVTVAIIGLLTPYDWFYDRVNWGWGYPTSLVGLVAALLIIGLGMWSRVKILRLYGLVLAIACVLKLFLIDIGSVNSITRVVAFLGGAAVCFGISALYNYTAKRFDKELAVPPVVPLVAPATSVGSHQWHQ